MATTVENIHVKTYVNTRNMPLHSHENTCKYMHSKCIDTVIEIHSARPEFTNLHKVTNKDANNIITQKKKI